MKEQEEKKHEIKEHKEKNTLTYVVLALVSLLLVFSVVQAFEINNLKDDISVGKISSASTTSQQAQVRTQAPAMVGGC